MAEQVSSRGHPSTKRFRCRIGKHRWTRKPGGSALTCYDCGAEGRRRKTVFCHLGLHNWIRTTSGGEPYFECRHCGHYGGDVGRYL